MTASEWSDPVEAVLESDGRWWLKDLFEPSRNCPLRGVSYVMRNSHPPEHEVVARLPSPEEGRELSRLLEPERPLLLQGPYNQWYVVLAGYQLEGSWEGANPMSPSIVRMTLREIPDPPEHSLEAWRAAKAAAPPPVLVVWSEVFPNHPQGDRDFLKIDNWPPVQFFVGRNGSGKSRTARILVRKLQDATRQQCRFLSTDRLAGIMAFSNYGWGSMPGEARGAPLALNEIQQARQMASEGVAADVLHALRDDPTIFLRLAALLRRAFGREIRLEERSGFLDPVLDTGGTTYSLLRDEGHGLRELVVLLVATYRADWKVLVVDEPELHLHPSLTRLWLTELEAECERTKRCAIVVTHEPRLVQPGTCEDLHAIWVFAPGRTPTNLGTCVPVERRGSITSSLKEFPELVSSIVFSPRPALVEGAHDVAALTTALHRVATPEAVFQTDLVPCGGSAAVATWFTIATAAGLDVRAVADLDALFDSSFAGAMNDSPHVATAYVQRFSADPPTTTAALSPIFQAMKKAGIPPQATARAKWLAALHHDDEENGAARARKDQLLALWREAGVWLHPQGTIESVLGLGDKASVSSARQAASVAGAIDEVARFVAFQIDLTADVEALLQVEVERIAQELQRALALQPDRTFTGPVGSKAEFDELLVSVHPAGSRHRIVVRRPEVKAGWWVEFDRDTSANQLKLQPPAT